MPLPTTTKTISDLAEMTAPDDADLLIADDVSEIETKKLTVANLRASMLADLAASQSAYDNGTSGLAATDVQDAIDELAADVAVLDHGALTGLADDDHTQYLLHDGTRAMSGALRILDGSVASPAIQFVSSPTTGIIAPETLAPGLAGVLIVVGGDFAGGFVAEGTEVQFRSNGGSVAVPAVAIDQPYSGLYSTGGGGFGLGANATAVARVQAPSGTNPQLQLVDGSASAPSLSFQSLPDAGLYVDSGFLKIGAGGIQVATVSGAGSNPQLMVPPGVVTAPSIRVGNAQNGLFAPSTSAVGIAAAGVEVARFVNDGSAQQLLIADGSASAPSLAFASDPNSGIYAITGDQYGFSLGGTLRWRLLNDEFASSRSNGILGSQVTNGRLTVRGFVSTAVATPAVTLTSAAALNGTAVGDQTIALVSGTINQAASSSGSRALAIEIADTSLGSGSHRLIEALVGGTGKFRVGFDGKVLATTANAVPGYAFLGSATAEATGLSYDSSRGLQLTYNGAEKFHLNSTHVIVEATTLVQGGTLAAPGVAFESDTNTGLQQPATDQISLVAGGLEALRAGASAGAAYAQIADGSNLAPSLAFINNPTTGIFNGALLGPGVEGLLVSVGGDLVGGFLNEGSGGQLCTMAGTALVPIVAIAQGDCGFYAPLGGQIAAVAEGVEVFRWQAPGSTSPQVLLASGAMNAPSASFSSDATTGMWLEGGGELVFSVFGTDHLRVSDNDACVRSGGDLVTDLGQPGKRWGTLYTGETEVGDGSYPVRTRTFEFTSTTGGMDTVHTLPINSKSCVWIEVEATCRNDADTKWGSFKRFHGVYRNASGGAATAAGTMAAIATIRTDAKLDADITVSGNNALIRVGQVGGVVEDIQWSVTLKWQEIAT